LSRDIKILQITHYEGDIMEIIKRSIHIIDYEANQVLSRETPASFDEYVSELILHINNNDSVRQYKTRSKQTEIISSILSFSPELEAENFDDDDNFNFSMNIIAERLLREEREAQERISRTKTSIKKGSLLQVLFRNEDEYSYLLAKVNHDEFFDDNDFISKTGFPKDKKNIWKSCLIALSDLDANEFYAKVYSDTQAKFWNDGFLELDEVVKDEENTERAFKAIDTTLNRNFSGKSKSSVDKTIIRNAFVSYFKSNDHIDYNSMITTILGNYQPTDVEQSKIEELKDKISELPEKRNFDRQFTSISRVINARIRQKYIIAEVKVSPFSTPLSLKIA